jgi:hypothetical protein
VDYLLLSSALGIANRPFAHSGPWHLFRRRQRSATFVIEPLSRHHHKQRCSCQRHMWRAAIAGIWRFFVPVSGAVEITEVLVIRSYSDVGFERDSSFQPVRACTGARLGVEKASCHKPMAYLAFQLGSRWQQNGTRHGVRSVFKSPNPSRRGLDRGRDRR